MFWEALSGIIGPIVRIIGNTTESQRAYLDWRLSEEGRRYYSAAENNALWKALARGDTSVLDVAIADKQKRIDDLRRETGLITILVMCLGLSLAGCHTYSIPDSIPLVSHDSLVSNEVTYVVSDMEVKTPEGKTQKLYGQWHIVSPDFVKTHIRNQDDLIKSLTALKQEQDNDRLYVKILLGLVALCVVLWFVSLIRRRQ